MERTTNRGRHLQPGDRALTNFNGGAPVEVTITARQQGQQASQSGIQFQVAPALRNARTGEWFDADWFWPMESEG